MQGVFKNQKLSFQGVIFVRKFLCHTSCFSVFFAEKEEPTLIFFPTSCKLSACTGILIFALIFPQYSQFDQFLRCLVFNLAWSSCSLRMMQSLQLSPTQKFKQFSSSFPQNPFFQGLFKCPWSPKLNSRAFQALQGVARTLKWCPFVF